MKRTRTTTGASSHARPIAISNSSSLSATPRFPPSPSLHPLPLSFLSVPVPATLVWPIIHLLQSALFNTTLSVCLWQQHTPTATLSSLESTRCTISRDVVISVALVFYPPKIYLCLSARSSSYNRLIETAPTNRHLLCRSRQEHH